MSMLILFIKACLIGFAIAAPVGPIGMLCIKKTLESGLKGALLVGFGAALADSVYGLIAGLGLSAISNALLEHTHIIKITGGIFLLYLAYKEARSVNSSKHTHIKNTHWIKQIGEVFFLTITNPMTILSFIGIFASISGGVSSAKDSLFMVLGIFTGSMLWWLTLGILVSSIKHKLPKPWIDRIKYISAIILGLFGAYALFS